MQKLSLPDVLFSYT